MMAFSLGKKHRTPSLPKNHKCTNQPYVLTLNFDWSQPYLLFLPIMGVHDFFPFNKRLFFDLFDTRLAVATRGLFLTT
jgi:hypothetical protein